MRREIMWAAWEGIGLEHVRIALEANEIRIDGAVVTLDEGRTVRGRYQIRCDAGWRVRAAHFDPLTGAKQLELLADGAGHWSDGNGEHLPELDGCIDIDLTLTPLTNTLPIRRLGLASGEAAVLSVAYIDGATLQRSVSNQRYTCLHQRDASGGRYRFEGLDTGFQAELTVDADGLVVDYPPLFRRVWQGSERTKN